MIENWNTNKAIAKQIDKCAKRAVEFAKSKGIKDYDFMTARLDLDAVHSNGCPLDFERMLYAADFDFGHDIFGINHHLDRETGKLRNCFVPRLALKQPMPPLNKATRMAIGLTIR